MAEKSKTKKRLTNPAKRHRQNVRTFLRVQKRRQKHAQNHGVTVESLGATRWTTVPSSKAQPSFAK